MTISIPALLNAASKHLATISDSPRLDAEVLLAAVFSASREDLLTRSTVEVPRDAVREYEELIGQRLEGTPVAYIVGHKDFYGLPIAVNPSVLIPRPVTELLVDHILEQDLDAGHGAIADIGTGSGAIALALAANQSKRPIIGSDLSFDALRQAAANSRRLGLQGRVDWRFGNLLEPVSTDPLHIIVANLPYLTPEQVSQPNLEQEPASALDGGPGGLTAIRSLLRQASERHDWHGLVLEFEPSQAKEVRDELLSHWSRGNIVDLSDGRSLRGFGLWR